MIIRILQTIQNSLKLFLGGYLNLSLLVSIKMSSQRFLLSADLEICIQRPILLRNKCVDLLLTVCYDPQRDRQPPLDFLPEQRTDLISYHTVKAPPRLLLIHEIHVDIPGIL